MLSLAFITNASKHIICRFPFIGVVPVGPIQRLFDIWSHLVSKCSHSVDYVTLRQPPPLSHPLANRKYIDDISHSRMAVETSHF